MDQVVTTMESIEDYVGAEVYPEWFAIRTESGRARLAIHTASDLMENRLLAAGATEEEVEADTEWIHSLDCMKMCQLMARVTECLEDMAFAKFGGKNKDGQVNIVMQYTLRELCKQDFLFYGWLDTRVEGLEEHIDAIVSKHRSNLMPMLQELLDMFDEHRVTEYTHEITSGEPVRPLTVIILDNVGIPYSPATYGVWLPAMDLIIDLYYSFIANVVQYTGIDQLMDVMLDTRDAPRKCFYGYRESDEIIEDGDRENKLFNRRPASPIIYD